MFCLHQLPLASRMRKPGHGYGYGYGCGCCGYGIRTRSEIPHRWQSTRLFIQPWDAINIHRRRAEIWDDFDARHAGCPSRCAVSKLPGNPSCPVALLTSSRILHPESPEAWLLGSPGNRIIPFPLARRLFDLIVCHNAAVSGANSFTSFLPFFLPSHLPIPGEDGGVLHISDIKSDLLVCHRTRKGLYSDTLRVPRC